MNNEFLMFLKADNQVIFIEAEARLDKMLKFIQKYNTDFGQAISLKTDGICLLGDVDKWGVELRIYFNDIRGIPKSWESRKYKTRHYRSNEFAYRLDDNKLVRFMFDNGYHIGRNQM